MEVRQFETEQVFIEATAGLLREFLMRKSAHSQGIMLAGGRTPMAAYNALVQSPVTAFENVHIMFSDERMVPLDSPDNNAFNAMGMIEALQIPPDRVHRVQSHFSLEKAAERYNHDLQYFLERGRTFTLGLLGLGTDGHTASLFTREDAERGNGRLAISVSRPEPPDRVSVTRDLLLKFDRLVFLAAGPDKVDMVNTLRNDPHSIPAGLATTGHPNLHLWHCPNP